jgi:putative peptidoglycan lipid II flippase
MESLAANKTTPRKSLLRSTGIVASMTLLSRLMGFVRDMIIAHYFGALAGVDAYFVAFKIPNFMRRLFAEGAFSQAFVPILAEYQEQRSTAQVREFIAKVAGTLGFTLIMVTIVGELAAPFIIRVFAPGFAHGGERFVLASHMLRLTFPYLMLISLTAMTGAVLNTYNRFAVPAFTPVLLNVSIILAAVFLSPYCEPPITALAWGIFAAGVVQLIFQLPFLWRIGLLVRPHVSWRDSGIKRVLKLMVPALFGVSVAQINLVIDTVFASFLPVGSVSWLYYSDRFTNLPLGVFGVAVATVILPHLSRKHADHNPQAFQKTMDWALRAILLIALPAAIGLAMTSGTLLATLLGYGAFTGRDVYMASLSLRTFALGVPAFMLVKILAPGFYAKQDIKTPVKIAFVAMVTNTVLNFILIKPLAHEGLALATSIAGWLNAMCLLFILWNRSIYQPQRGWGRFWLQIIVANVTIVLWLWFWQAPLSEWLAHAWHWRALRLFELVGGSIVLYVGVLLLLGFDYRQLKQ